MEGGPTRQQPWTETPQTLAWRPSHGKEEGGASGQDDAMEAAPALLLPHHDHAMEAVGFLGGYSSSKKRAHQGCIFKVSSSGGSMDAGTPPWKHKGSMGTTTAERRP